MTDHFNVECSVDPFQTQETAARMYWYGFNGIPDVYIDGKVHEVGADHCTTAYQIYYHDVLTRQQETGGIAPVAITGVWNPGDGNLAVRARFELQDQISPSPLRGTVLVIEDWIHATGPRFYSGVWNHVARRIIDQNLTLVNPGDTDSMVLQVPVDPTWNVHNLHLVAYVQRTGAIREILQASLLSNGPVSVAYPSSPIAGALELPRPNPFSSSTEITLNIPDGPAALPWRLEIFDSGGRRVATLLQETLAPGRYTRTWNGTAEHVARVQSGVYYARLSGPERQFQQKLILLK